MTNPTESVPGEALAMVHRPNWMRWVVVVALTALGAGFLWLFLAKAHSGIETMLITFAATGAFWLAFSAMGARSSYVILTKEGFYDEHGDMLCPMSEVDKVDAGLLALRPSKGFLLRLRTSAPWGWSPGLWWRFGKRFGVGGATPGRAGKDMADQAVALIVERDGVR